jgi:type VI secretion system protein ImpG
MDPRLLEYYNHELQHIREMCSEFAEEYPKIAGRLGIEGFECADPYVERLIEGFAYMAARVKLKVDAEYPRFSQNLLEMVYPGYLAPSPSMGIVRLSPDMTQGTLKDGIPVRRGSVLRSQPGRHMQTTCEYRTAHDVTLWPVELTDCRYLPSTGDVASVGITDLAGVKAALRFRFRTIGELSFADLPLDSLSLYVRGADPVAMQLYEQIMGNKVGLIIQSTDRGAVWRASLSAENIRPLGFSVEQALLPANPRYFSGYRLLKEYFAFPERFMFVDITGFDARPPDTTDREFDVIITLDRSVNGLQFSVDTSRFSLFCTPVINLFPKRADRIHVSDRENEYHVVADRSRPLDFEVFDIQSVVGYGATNEPDTEFLPFYACSDFPRYRDHKAFYTVYRSPRVISSRQRLRGPRTNYIGSETYVSIVDATEAPYSSNLRQVAVTTQCTNRDLPLQMPVGVGKTDLTLDLGAPVESVRFIAGPTEPRASIARREIAWRLINQLSLNHVSLVDVDEGRGPAALKDVLTLYAAMGDPSLRRQIEGIVSIESEPQQARLTGPGPGSITLARGLEITVTLDEAAFQGSGVFLLGAVLERFLTLYTSINSFTETVLRTPTRGEVMRWAARIGQRNVI